MQSKRRFSVLLAASVVAIIFGAHAYASDDEINQEVNDLQVQLVKKPAPDATMAHKISPKKKKSLPKIAQLKKSNVQQAPVWHSDVTDNSVSVLPPGPPPAPADAPRALDKRAPIVAASDTSDIPEPPMEPSPDYQSDMTATDVPPPVSAVPDVPAQSVARDGNYLSTRVSHEGPILGGYVQRVSLLPGGTMSTFDGQNQSQVVPSTANYPVAFGGGAAVLVDFDLGMSPNFMLVSGGQWLMLGAQTGYAPYASSGYNTFTYNDSVVLNYLAIPLELKYLMKGEHQSGFFAQAGLQPAFLMSHIYTTYSGLSNEFRFGSYSLWDIQVTAAAGYDFKINNHFHAVAQISGFQGFIPVFGTYSVYNVGGSAMLGIGYTL